MNIEIIKELLKAWQIPTMIRSKHKAFDKSYLRESFESFKYVQIELIYKRSSANVFRDMYKLIEANITMPDGQKLFKFKLNGSENKNTEYIWDPEILDVKYTQLKYVPIGELIELGYSV